MIELPPATSIPCNDCPWRRNAAPGWLGPMDSREWVAVAHSDEPIACHQTINTEYQHDDWSEEGDPWEQPSLRQCAGAAIYRVNVAKMPRNPDDAACTAKADRDNVFSNPNEFIEYHRR